MKLHKENWKLAEMQVWVFRCSSDRIDIKDSALLPLLMLITFALRGKVEIQFFYILNSISTVHFCSSHFWQLYFFCFNIAKWWLYYATNNIYIVSTSHFFSIVASISSQVLYLSSPQNFPFFAFSSCIKQTERGM